MVDDFFRSIVIATDGSENTQKVISYGINIAKLSGATVHALHLMDTFIFPKTGLQARNYI